MREATLYDRVGACLASRRLVDRFYGGRRSILLKRTPITPASRAPRRLPDLVQYWGGRATYLEARGHPRLRARHSPFAIGTLARDRWLLHMRAAIDASDAPDDAKAQLHDYMTMAADAMRNRDQA
jgi:hemoglobin